MDQQELDFLTQQKIELLLQRKTKQFVEDLEALKQQVRSHEAHISSLRAELAKRPMPTRQAPVITPMTRTPEPARQAPPAQPAPAATQQKAAAQSSSSGTSHPRQGNYKSDDVSIEKYFNFSGR